MVAIAATMAALAIIAAVWLGKGLLDPDGFLGPAWMRGPLLVGGALLADLLPRTLWGSRLKPALMPAIFKERIRTHWTRDRIILVVSGVVFFYITYVAYRNLKSFLPAIRGAENTYDRDLHLVDRTLMFGHEPAVLLHNILGTSFSAQLLSSVYLWFLPLVPLALTAWVVWSRKISYGYWFAVSQAIAWTLGTASYYALPTLGPGFEYPWLYQDLSTTASSRLMEALQYGRQDVNYNVIEGAVQSVAGFASLHCAITMLVALMIQATIKNRVLHVIGWVNFGITVVATIYFGWHYIADDVAGIVIALVSYYLGGIASYQKFDRRRVVGEESAPTTAAS